MDELQNIFSSMPMVNVISHVRLICYEILIYAIFFTNYYYYGLKIKLYDDIMMIDDLLKPLGTRPTYTVIYLLQLCSSIFATIFMTYELVVDVYILKDFIGALNALINCKYHI